jgi:hypothetical protein
LVLCGVRLGIFVLCFVQYIIVHWDYGKDASSLF